MWYSLGCAGERQAAAGGADFLKNPWENGGFHGIYVRLMYTNVVFVCFCGV